MNATPLELHTAYTSSLGIDLALNCVSERLWYEAAKWGIKPDDVRLVIKARIKRNLTLTYKRSLLIHRLIGDESDLAEFVNELAEIRAGMRKPVYDAGKVVVLGATGRETEPPSPPARNVGEILKAMREATNQ